MIFRKNFSVGGKTEGLGAEGNIARMYHAIRGRKRAFRKSATAPSDALADYPKRQPTQLVRGVSIRETIQVDRREGDARRMRVDREGGENSMGASLGSRGTPAAPGFTLAFVAVSPGACVSACFVSIVGHIFVGADSNGETSATGARTNR